MNHNYTTSINKHKIKKISVVVGLKRILRKLSLYLLPNKPVIIEKNQVSCCVNVCVFEFVELDFEMVKQ